MLIPEGARLIATALPQGLLDAGAIGQSRRNLAQRLAVLPKIFEI